MNALVSLDSILEPAQALTATSLFGSGQVETILSAIEKDVRAEAFDITTPEGRERIKSVAYKVARSKTTLDEIGKEHVAHIKAQAGAIDAERRTIRDRLDALKDEVRGPLTAWEAAEEKRISDNEAAIVAIMEQPHAMATAAEISAQLVTVRTLAERDWQEFSERGDAAFKEAVERLMVMLTAAEQRERDAAELAELRRQKAERDEQDAKAAWQKAENERMQRAAEEATERERVRAEQQAERDRQRAEQAEREKIAAAARAVEQERERVARVKADEERAAAKREANKKHRAKVHGEITAAILALILNEECAAAGHLASVITGRLATGEIPHVSITY